MHQEIIVESEKNSESDARYGVLGAKPPPTPCGAGLFVRGKLRYFDGECRSDSFLRRKNAERGISQGERSFPEGGISFSMDADVFRPPTPRRRAALIVDRFLGKIGVIEHRFAETES